MPRRLAACLSTVVLAVAGAAAGGCGSSGSAAPSVEPGAPAGDVREVSGTVTARRGADAAARPLAVGDVVSGDDVIETVAGASVVIELRHNGARWALGASQSKQVASSLAWKAPRGEGTAAVGGDRSTAAGRLAEREGADTAATAIAEERAAAPPGAAPAPAAVYADPTAAAPPPPPTKEKERASPRSGTRAAEPPEERTKVDEPDEIVGMGDVATTGRGSGASGGGGSGPGTGAESVAPPAPRPSAPAPAKATLTSVSVTGALSRDDARRSVARRIAQVSTCWVEQVAAGATGTGTVGLVLQVGADGAVTGVDVEIDTSVEAARDCIAGKAKAWTFPAAAEASEVHALFELGS